MLDLISISAMHQRALQVEKQVGHTSGSGMITNAGNNTRGVEAAENLGKKDSIDQIRQRLNAIIPGIGLIFLFWFRGNSKLFQLVSFTFSKVLGFIF